MTDSVTDPLARIVDDARCMPMNGLMQRVVTRTVTGSMVRSP